MPDALPASKPNPRLIKAFPCDTKAFRKEYGDERTDALIEEANKLVCCVVIAGRTGYGCGFFQYGDSKNLRNVSHRLNLLLA
jgi:hypothetical protein